MNIWDIIIGIIIFLIIGLALYKIFKDRKNKKNCCGNCTNCEFKCRK